MEKQRKCLYEVSYSVFFNNNVTFSGSTSNVPAYTEEEAEDKCRKLLHDEPKMIITRVKKIAKIVGTFTFSNAISLEIYSVLYSGDTEWVVAYEDKEFQYGEAIEKEEKLGLMFGNLFIPFAEVMSCTI